MLMGQARPSGSAQLSLDFSSPSFGLPVVFFHPLPRCRDRVRTQSKAMKEIRPIHISGYAREPGDFYPTPSWVTECLLQYIKLRGPVWEPCCGDGAIAKVLAARGHEVVASDLADYGFGSAGVDIFQVSQMPDRCRALVTNPPYGDGGARGRAGNASQQMLNFTQHALCLTQRARGQLALLVRFQWIAGQKVAGLLSSAPLEAVIVLTRRIRWFDRGKETNTGQHHHAWIFFDFERASGRRSELVFADALIEDGRRTRHADRRTLPLFDALEPHAAPRRARRR